MYNDAADMEAAAVLTMRKRPFQSNVKLSWALDELAKMHYRFTVVDCSFCRNTPLSGLVGSLPFGPEYADKLERQ